MWVRCALTVASVMSRRRATSWLLSPLAMSWAMSCSRRLRRLRSAASTGTALAERAASSSTMSVRTRWLAHTWPWCTRRTALIRVSTVALLTRIPRAPHLSACTAHASSASAPARITHGRVVLAEPGADGQGAHDLRIDEQDVRRAGPHELAHRQRARLAHQGQARIGVQDAAQAGAE